MDALVLLGRTLGFSLPAGVNLYATVAILGLAARHDWVALPPQFDAFDNDLVIYGALALYLVEFLADKIPWVDTAWDAVHTVVRPVGGALVAVAALGEASPGVEVAIALLGGATAAGAHAAKAGTRLLVNTSPEPVSNVIVSVVEDVLVIGLVALALVLPVLALGVAFLALAGIAWLGRRLLAGRRRVPAGGG